MKILSLGSLNIDFIYNVSHISLEGETISARERERSQGGKGLNQSIALARAGATVYMAGCVGADGEDLLEMSCTSFFLGDLQFYKKSQKNGKIFVDYNYNILYASTTKCQ